MSTKAQQAAEFLDALPENGPFRGLFTRRELEWLTLASAALRASEAVERCSQCGEPFDHPNHDQRVPVSVVPTMPHPFTVAAEVHEAVRESETGWQPIANPDRGLFLVTNNMAARDAHGDMSHVWLTDAIHAPQRPGDEPFWCHSGDFGARVVGLTHCQAIKPLPVPAEPQRETK